MTMHIFEPEDGPTVTIELPLTVARDLSNALYHHVTPNMLDTVGPLMDEIDAQITEQVS